MTSTDAAQQVLAFLQGEGQKEHSADEIAALIGLERPAVDAALTALEAAGQVGQQTVSGYGGSEVMWGVRRA